MSDIDGGAAAPADSAAVASNEPVIAATPNPVSAEPLPEPVVDPKTAKPDVKPEAIKEKEPKPPVSTRDALKKAAEKVSAENKDAPKDAKDAKPAEKASAIKDEGQPRAEDGKFAAKEPAKDASAAEPAKDAAKPVSDTSKPADQAKTPTDTKPASETPKPAEAAKEAKPVLPSHTASEPPKRFSQDAKEAWASAPDPVRAEVSRMERELTAGFEKHRASAEAFESVREFDEMARQSGTDLKTALTNYTNMEKVLRADPLKGLELICQNAGLSLRDVAAHVMGQTPDQQASQSDATIRDLRAELTALKQQVGSVTQNFEQQRTQTAQQKVEAFAADPAHSRFEELSDDIAFFMKSGRTKDLAEAYTMAERLNPAPVKAPAAAVPAASTAPIIELPKPDLAAQTAKGSKSVTGSPSPGSSPANSRPSNSIKEAIRRAAAAV